MTAGGAERGVGDETEGAAAREGQSSSRSSKAAALVPASLQEVPVRRASERQVEAGAGRAGRTLLLTDGRVARVCERTRLAVAQARHVVLIAAEVLRRRPAQWAVAGGGQRASEATRECQSRWSVERRRRMGWEDGGRADALDFVRAELGVDDGPDDVVGLHRRRRLARSEGRGRLRRRRDGRKGRAAGLGRVGAASWRCGLAEDWRARASERGPGARAAEELAGEGAQSWSRKGGRRGDRDDGVVG